VSFSRVQEARNAPGTAGVTTRSVTISASGGGNLILVIVITGSSNIPTHNTPTDNATGGSNTYVQIGTTLNNNDNLLSLWYAKNSRAGATSVTSTVSIDPVGFFDVYVAEYSGGDTTAPLDTTNGGTGSSATAASGNFTVTAGDLLFGCALTPSTSATNLANLVDTTDGNGIGDTLSATGGSQQVTFTTTSGGWCCRGACFKAAAAATVVNPNLLPGLGDPVVQAGNMVSDQ
jgi:hypothetical protein